MGGALHIGQLVLLTVFPTFLLWGTAMIFIGLGPENGNVFAIFLFVVWLTLLPCAAVAIFAAWWGWFGAKRPSA